MVEAPHVPCSATEMLRAQFRCVHKLQLLDVDGRRREAATGFAQLVLCEDLTVSGFLRARQPLAFSTWRNRTGMSELPSLRPAIDWRGWTARVQLDLDQLRCYAKAVHSATDDVLSNEISESGLHLLNALFLRLALGCESARVVSSS